MGVFIGIVKKIAYFKSFGTQVALQRSGKVSRKYQAVFRLGNLKRTNKG
ncbi:hypothetical protein BH10ACI1_BH10ACI1_24370 [soil metagenome]